MVVEKELVVGQQQQCYYEKEEEEAAASANDDDKNNHTNKRVQFSSTTASTSTSSTTTSTTKRQRSHRRRRRRRRSKRMATLSDFTAIQESHPLGVLPGGNRFFDNQKTVHNHNHNNNMLLLNNDDDGKLWLQHILPFCDATSLSQIVQVSRYLYVLGHYSELWRDLVLRDCEVATTATTKRPIDRMGKSWKDTYVLLFGKNNNSSSENDDNFVPFRPMKMSGIYSDTLYQSHLCRSFAIPDVWLEETTTTTTLEDDDDDDDNTIDYDHHCDPRQVPIVPVDQLSAQDFFTKYEKPNRPVVVRGAAHGRAVERWKDWDYLRHHHQQQQQQQNCTTSDNKEKTFRTTSGAAPLPGYFTLKAYQQYATNFDYLEESPLYLFDRNVFFVDDDNDNNNNNSDNNSDITTTPNTTSTKASWYDDFFPAFYQKCPYWDPSHTEHGHDLLQHLGRRQRPDHTWFIAGPQRSGSVFHIDPNCTHAWNACIQGRKRWIFYPPGTPPPGVLPSHDGDEVALPLSVGEWIVQYWEEHVEQYTQRPVGERPLEVTTVPGDVIFVPHGWWHSVINLDGTINVAVTHNYLSPSNLGNALKFFVEKQDHISGCRDRKADQSIQPEDMYDSLVAALQEKEPHFLKTAMAQTEWTCKAWSSSSGNPPPTPTPTRNSGNACAEESSSAALDSGGEQQQHQQRKSIMEKSEQVASFSFSFL